MADIPSNTRDSVFLLDISAYIFRAYHAIRPLTTAEGFPTNAIFGVTRMMMRLLQDAPDPLIIAVKDAPGPSWRAAEFAAYKANRPPAPEDLKVQFDEIYDMINDLGIPSVMEDGQEADDLIAGMARHFADAGRPVVIVSADKDLLQLVNDRILMWDPMRDTLYTADAVQEKWGVPPQRIADILALMGDSSDNIPGVAGVGRKRAEALVSEYGSISDILARLDELPDQKWANNLRENPDAATLSLRLIQLEGAMPSAIDPDQLMRGTPDLQGLKERFRKYEFQTMIRDLDKIRVRDGKGSDPEPDIEVEPVRISTFLNDKDLRTETDPDAIAQLLTAEIVAFDTETTGLETHTAEIVGFSISTTGRDGVYVPLAHHDGANGDWTAIKPILKEWAEDPDRRKWGQNLKYDIQILRREGIRMVGVAADSMLASYLLSPHTRGHGMDAMAERELDHETMHFSDVAPDKDFRNVAIDKATAYAAEDAVVTWALCEKLHPRLESESIDQVYRDIDVPLVPVLADMEWWGIEVNIDRLQAMETELTDKINQIETRIKNQAGREINIASPKQIGELLFDEMGLPSKGAKRTKTGAWSTNAAVLEDLKDEHEIVGQILDHRTWSKLLSTYVVALQKAVLPETGRIHTQFQQTIAATGRLSSINPNLQNIPVRDEWGDRLRGAFQAARGFTLVGADYSQVELRVLAHMSGDPGLLMAFRGGRDVHTHTATEILDIAEADVTAEHRRLAKTINFGLMYGMGSQRLAKSLGISIADAKAYIEKYFDRYPGVREFRDQTISNARSNGFVSTLYGRKRWLPEFASGNGGLIAQAERVAINSPIQGTAADIMKIAMIRVHKRLLDEFPDARMLLQVHDELLLEVPDDQVTDVEQMLVSEMRDAARLDVPLLVESGTGPDWHAAHG